LHYYDGFLSLYSHPRIIDLLGLNDPEFVPVLRRSDHTLPLVFNKAKPAYWIDNGEYLNRQSRPIRSSCARML
jgi:hypothetical protein